MLASFVGFPENTTFLVLFTPRCYAERGIATAKSSLCPSVRLSSVCLSVTLRYRDHIG